MTSQTPEFILGKEILIASSYRRENHLQEVKSASFIFSSLGFKTYPHHLTEPINLGEDFIFLGGGSN